ncbi:SDR family oxidoreductase [Horticoccus sp. 23ND18S-11]|uniref:SDR family oxidoreductase n=1 Tax=Horticoccus sp. 23ND18S-11 TaxID=3391832 RepID=UPI0039C9B488
MSTPQKIALVTGAGSGIGRACAHALLQTGFTVVLAGRRREPLEATLRDSGRPESEGLVVPADVADPASVGALFEQVRARFGRLDLLFNNAGINVPNVAIDDLSFEQWRHVIDINLTGAFLCAQAAFRLMKTQTPRGGRIINNGSVSAQAPRPDSVAYTTAKHGITGLTKSLSLDGRRFDIACGQIDIGNTDTPLAGRMKKGVPQADGTIAIEPTFDVSHVARAVVYMASLPLEANVSTMTVMATKMPLVGRG